VTLGCDIQSVDAIRAKSSLLGNRALFTEYECTYVDGKPDPWPTLTGLFCAKEACVKAMSDGASAGDTMSDFGYLQLEIRHAQSGRPEIVPHGRLRDWLEARRLALQVSISHSGAYAMAVACLGRQEEA